ncbi:MAG: nitrilase-related carbon-nitrogen hydrolase, partial [Candidatus Nanopelagicaceae bacterium]
MPPVNSARLRLASAQINPIVGDIAGNIEKVLAAALEAKAQGAQILLTPEMVVTGYPVEDLALRPAFRRASIEAIQSLATRLRENDCGEMLIAVGYMDDDGRPLNSLALVHEGEMRAKYVKRHLPN